MLNKLDKLLNRNLAIFREEFRRLRKGLIKCIDYIFNFLEDPSIPPANNALKGGVITVKIKQMISGILGYDKVANAFMALHSNTYTAYKTDNNHMRHF